MVAPTVAGTAVGGRLGGGAFTVTPPAGASWVAVGTCLFADTITPPAGATLVSETVNATNTRRYIWHWDSQPGTGWSLSATTAPTSVVMAGYNEATSFEVPPTSNLTTLDSPSATSVSAGLALRTFSDQSASNQGYPAVSTIGRARHGVQGSAVTWFIHTNVAHDEVAATTATGTATWTPTGFYRPVASTAVLTAPATAVVLTTTNSAHAHTSDTVGPLTAGGTLQLQDGRHGHTSGQPTLTAGTALQVQDSTHQHASTTGQLAAAGVLLVAGSGHRHDSEPLTLTGRGALDVDDSHHPHASAVVELAGTAGLLVGGSRHVHDSERVTLTGATILPDDARATTRPAHLATVTTRTVSPATVTTSTVGEAHVVTAAASQAATTTRTVSDANTVSRVASDAHTTTSPAQRATATTRENAWQST